VKSIFPIIVQIKRESTTLMVHDDDDDMYRPIYVRDRERNTYGKRTAYRRKETGVP